MFIQGAGTAERTYDAIVVGSGISGGWAAKELTEKGLRTLVLERGRDVKHPDYPTAMTESWQFAGRTRLPPGRPREAGEAEPHGLHDASGVGALVRQRRRESLLRGPALRLDARLPRRRTVAPLGTAVVPSGASSTSRPTPATAIAVDWPIRYADMAPWYDYVERFAGISGSREGLPQLPDGQFLPPMEMNCLERQVKDRIAKSFGGRPMIIGRVANLTQPHNGRGGCQYRNRCIRGCPYGAYFSSNAATLPAAYATGKLTLRPFSIVTELIYDPKTRRATGVRIVDAETNQTTEYFARVIFLCASAIASTFILLNSKSRIASRTVSATTAASWATT